MAGGKQVHNTAASTWWRIIGPALLFSGAAVGTSHLVQSTRAGAMYGLALAGVIVITCILKYPAYRFGVDYGHARRRSILSGYRELGLWAPILFAAVTVPIMPIITAAIAAATAGILVAVTGLAFSVALIGSVLLAAAAALLMLGGYEWLDRVNRVLIVFLVLSTVATTVMVLPRVAWSTLGDFSWTGDPAAILFVIALAGFMPNPLDVAITQSMWTAETEKGLGEGRSSELGATRSAFLSGYVITALLALCFCIMGAGVMHDGGVVPERSAPGFAAQLIDLYGSVLGENAAILAAIAALSTMLTTVLAALDVGGRNIASAYAEISGRDSPQQFRQSYLLIVPALVGMAGCALFLLLSDFAAFMDLATSAAFVAAPLIAALNHIVVTRKTMPEAARPRAFIQALNLLAIAVMIGLSVAYFVL